VNRLAVSPRIHALIKKIPANLDTTRNGARLKDRKRTAEVAIMAFLISQFLFLFFGLLGLLTWSCADMPIAVREIAINTRRDPSHGTSYPMITVLSVCIRIFAVLLWLTGLIAGAVVIIDSSILQGIVEVIPR
jgi:hypothetical protein